MLASVWCCPYCGGTNASQGRAKEKETNPLFITLHCHDKLVTKTLHCTLYTIYHGPHVSQTMVVATNKGGVRDIF